MNSGQHSIVQVSPEEKTCCARRRLRTGTIGSLLHCLHSNGFGLVHPVAEFCRGAVVRLVQQTRQLEGEIADAQSGLFGIAGIEELFEMISTGTMSRGLPRFDKYSSTAKPRQVRTVGFCGLGDFACNAERLWDHRKSSKPA